MSETKRTNQVSPAAPSTERVEAMKNEAAHEFSHASFITLADVLEDLRATREQLQAATALLKQGVRNVPEDAWTKSVRAFLKGEQ